MGTAFVAAAVLTLSPPALVARAVAANEALYRDIDVTYRSEYRLAAPRHAAGLAVRSVLAEDSDIRVVSQGPLHRVVATRRTDAGDGGRTTSVTASAFDGERTRTRTGSATGSAAGAPPPPPEAHFPHLWASGPQFPRLPLSAVLTGGRPARPGNTVALGLLAPAAVEGESCVVVRCAAVWDGRPTGVEFYWLAVNKNYLPVRVERFDFFCSATHPAEVVTAGQFREVRPGVWVPYRVTRTAYDEAELRWNQRAAVGHVTTTTVTRAVLGPSHDRGFFQDLRADDA
jgi:hypothetical protein